MSDNPWLPLLDRFNEKTRAEAETLFKHIADIQTNLVNERDGLRKEIESLRKERDEMGRVLKKYDQIVTVNIGGQIFSTTVETLTKEPSLFTKMFSGHYELREHQGAPFIDRDPTHFRTILNYLRTNAFLQPKSSQDQTELLLEAEYYQIASLVEQLKGNKPANASFIEKLLFDSITHHPAVTISDGGLKATHSGGCGSFFAKVQNISWQKGRHYWEIVLETTRGCYSSMGVATSDWNSSIRLGDDRYSWTVRISGTPIDNNFSGLRHDGVSRPYHDVYPVGTRVGALLDLDVGTLEYVVDGERKGIAFDNLKGHVVTPVFEFCHNTIFRMNHNPTVTHILSKDDSSNEK